MVEDLPNRPVSHGQMPATSIRSGFSAPSQASPDFAALAGNVVHLWAAPLNLPADRLDHFQKILSGAELDRAARFHFEVHRNRYIASHGWLRQVLGQYLSLPPERLEFQHGPKGKPFLISVRDDTELQFNLAHSQDLALIGVGRGARLGVDVERIRELEDAQQLVDRFFSPGESTAFQLLAKDQKPKAFFNLWTRKEAWLKATGEGIAHLLDQVEVSFLPDEPARLLSLPKGYASADAWSIQDLNIGPEFAAAVVVASNRIRPQLYWTNQLKPVGL